MDIFYIDDETVFDERIVKYEMHTYNPYTDTTLGYTTAAGFIYPAV